jgi:hypothetical protein
MMTLMRLQESLIYKKESFDRTVYVELRYRTQ